VKSEKERVKGEEGISKRELERGKGEGKKGEW
jgi:hypothetical protein